MDESNRNLVLAIVLSLAVFLGYQFLLGKKPAQQQPAAVTVTSPTAPAPVMAPVANVERAQTLAEAPRIQIQTPRLHGSLSLAGGRIDDLTLNDYYETVERDKQVVLLSPAGTPAPYYVEFGWIPEGTTPVPTAQTVWMAAENHSLTPDTPVTLTWDNGAGLVFERSISVDANYLFTVRQKVTNRGGAPVTLRPYGSIVRLDPPTTTQAFGPAPSVTSVFEGALDEVSYKDLAEKGAVTHQATGGWIGMNDKYWLVAAVPPKAETVATTLRDVKAGDSNQYSADYQSAPQAVAPGGALETTSLVFAGAKDLNLLDDYQDNNGIDKLDRAVDFGWLYLLAKPFFLALDFIAKEVAKLGVVANFGIAILIFNVFLKIILFPLQDRSFHQMARMRDIQPKIAALKEKYGDDREKMGAAQMELFKREKINPASGCLPMLVQIPIFFALYRVLITSLEMRHAPFFGWIHDLSAPDPTTIFNLFGLIPIAPPHVVLLGLVNITPMLGIWPILYGGTMFLQQKMTPTPVADPTQARIMAMMPLFLVFVFTGFPAGLMIYYCWNNILTIGQMALIRRRAASRQAVAATKA